MPTPTFSIQETDKYIDYNTFLSDDFDANTYSNSIVNESSGDGSDVGTALSKLAFSIDILTKQIQEQVTANYEALLSQVTGIKELENVLDSVSSDISSLNSSLQRLLAKKRTDLAEQLSVYATELENLQVACELLRKLHRFISLKKRLELQLPSNVALVERDLTAAALTIYELETITDESDFEGIDVVTCELASIAQSKELIEEEAKKLLQEGMESQNQTKMASGLQVFYNMKQMGERVEELISTMLNDLILDIKSVVDMQSLQKEMKANGSTQSVRRVNNEPVGNQSPWTQAIWNRMEALMKDIGDRCIKIYNLEKVLELKKDPLTHVSFLEEVAKTLDATSLVSYFWRVLSMNFEKELKEATKGSNFLQNTFVGDYPKLLKLLHDFFSRVALHNGTPLDSQSPEYVIMLRSFHTFETGFLAKSLQRMYDVINSTFPSYGGLSKTPPGRNNVNQITRVLEHELEIASFETHLAQAVAKNCVKTLSMFCVKCDNLLPSSEQPIYAPNPNNAITTYLNLNIEIANILYYMHQSIWKILEEYPDKIVDIVKQGVDDCHVLMMNIGNKLVSSIKKDSDSVLLKIHQEDFSGQVRRGGFMEDDATTSGYIKELARHVRYYHTQILQGFSCGAEPKTWARQISKHILYVFVFQASIVRPLSEAGKLKLAGDMAELEFTISQFMTEYGARIEEVGDEYKALRAFRPLLFLDSAQLTAAHHTSGLDDLILIHHLIVRSYASSTPLPLPSSVYDLSREEYMKWMSSQTEKEAVQLVLDAITKGSKLTEDELSNIPEYKLILELASKV